MTFSRMRYRRPVGGATLGAPAPLVSKAYKGKVIQPVVPRNFEPQVDGEEAHLWLAIDARARRPAHDCRAAEDLFRISVEGSSPFRPDRLGWSRDRYADFARLLERRVFSLPDLKDLHRVYDGPSSGSFRVHDVWVGSPHPATSRHVGSPPELLNRLVARALDVQAHGAPRTAIAFYSMLTLLQIHPFEDGNGRVARGYCVWLLLRHLPASQYLVKLFESCWDRSRIDIHSISSHLQKSGDCMPLAQYLMGVEELRSAR